MAITKTASIILPLVESGDIYVSPKARGKFDFTLVTDETTLVSEFSYEWYLLVDVDGYYRPWMWIVEYDGISSAELDYFGNPKVVGDDSSTSWDGYSSGYHHFSTGSYLVASKTQTGLKLHSSAGDALEDANISVSFRIMTDSDGSGDYSVGMASQTTSLGLLVPSIPVKMSSFSSSSGFLDENITITISKGRTSYLSTIEYEFGTKSGTVVTKTSAGSINWQLPSHFVTEFGEDDIQKVGVLRMKVYDPALTDPIQETTTNFTAFLASSDLTPVMNPTVKDINEVTLALTGDSGTIIKHASIVEFEINAAAVKGAEIVKQQVKNGSQIIENVSRGTMTNIESNTFNFLAIDNRDMGIATALVVPRFIDYVRPSCSQEVSMEISGETGATADVRIYGNYYTGNFGSTSNELQVYIRHTQNDGTMGDWVELTDGLVPITNAAEKTYEMTFTISGLSYDIPYTFQCKVNDKLYEAQSGQYVLKILPIFDWSESDFNFNVPVNVNGNVTIAQGRNLNVGGGVFRDDFGILAIEAPNIDLRADNVSFNGTSLTGIETGEWTPTFTTSAAISSYGTRIGWYQRIGTVVTVGFMVTAICNDGYTSTGLALSGLPYNPINTAFGGGVCSRPHIAANYNFQCWAIGTNGQITARVQECNNTEKATLVTSASGCYYGAKDITITVGGTITYEISGGM